MDFFTKRYHPPGTSPVTLQQVDVEQRVPIKLYLTDYTASDFTEHHLAAAEACRD